MEVWIDLSGDDAWMIHDTGRLLPSRPVGFGGPRYLYERGGELLEVEPVIHNGLSAWKITRREA
jgi:hypothetical protein